MKKYTKGFTLIELLVVIAIIGILSSVVLSSLNTARDKGADAAIKANLTGMRPQAGIIYDRDANSYANVCTDPTILSALDAAKLAGSVLSTTTDQIGDAGGPGTATCHAATNGWAVETPLKTDPTLFFCVNYAGAATTTVGSTLLANEVDCSL